MAKLWQGTKQLAVRTSAASLYGFVIASTVVPPPLLANTHAVDTHEPPPPHRTDDASLATRFATHAASQGLVLSDEVAVESVGLADNNRTATVATMSAVGPVSDPLASVFFHRLQSYRLHDDAGNNSVVAESETVIGRQGNRVSLTMRDRFPRDLDQFAGRYSGLAGVRIERLIQFELIGFDRLVSNLTSEPTSHEQRPAQLGQMLKDGELSYEDYSETVRITYPDGQEKVVDGADFQAADLLGEMGGGAGAIDCTIDCFGDNGAEIGFFGAVCLVSGAVVCAVGCAVTAGVACIPCISAVSLGCGLATATGALGICLASCLFGVDPPTPTRTRTRTRTRTPIPSPTPPVHGDCNGDARTSISELIRGVRILLGVESVSRCRSMDLNLDGRVHITELISAIRVLLGQPA